MFGFSFRLGHPLPYFRPGFWDPNQAVGFVSNPFCRWGAWTSTTSSRPRRRAASPSRWWPGVWGPALPASPRRLEPGEQMPTITSKTGDHGFSKPPSSLLGWAPSVGTPKITQNTSFSCPYQNNHKQTTPLQRKNGAPQKEIRPKVVSPFWAPCSAGAVVSANSCLERAIPWKATL